MATLSMGALGVFGAACLIAFLTPFVTQGVGKQLGWQMTWPDLKRFALIVAPLVLLFVGGQFLELEGGGTLRFFAMAAAVPFLLSRLNFPAQLTGILLLLLTVLVTVSMDVSGLPSVAIIAGLVTWKLGENLLLRETATLEDVLPSLFWLAGLYWINAASPQELVGSRQGLLLGAIAVALFMRSIQGTFLKEDKLYVKRIALATTGGLLLLIYITKVMSLVAMDSLAVLMGAGIFLTYLFEAIEGKEDGRLSAPAAVKTVILIGIFTMLASRLLGTFGWIMLAPATLVATRSGTAVFAGLFWATRAMLQTYIVQFNANVTGVNILHPYVGAALYAGFLAALLLSVFMRDHRDKRLTLAVALGGATLLPLGATYFLHAEPTCSLLVSTTVAAVLLSVLGPVMYRQEIAQHDSLLLLPVQMIASATLANQLIPLGNEATAHDRLILLAYMAAALFVLALVIWWLTSGSRRQPVKAS